MSITSTVTMVGNITDEVQLRYAQSGVPVAGFTIASTDRVYDRSTGEWRDGDTVYLRATAWKNAGAENLVESLSKGARVIVTGRLKQRSYTTDDGSKRTVIELDVEEIGPSLKYATATPVKTQRTTAQAPADNAWQTAPATA